MHKFILLFDQFPFGIGPPILIYLVGGTALSFMSGMYCTYTLQRKFTEL